MDIGQHAKPVCETLKVDQKMDLKVDQRGSQVQKYREHLIRVSNFKKGDLFPDFVIGLHGIDDMARWEVFRDKKNA